ncbi:MAG TPA: TetR/AcrR family transcriptional regulator [Chroococcidiopsis sp.]
MLSRAADNLGSEPSCKPEQILQGAMQIFLQHGYAATSMDRVAAEAGVSKHTIYNHFQNKEGLFVALFERLVLRQFHLEFGCELPASESPERVLRRLAEVVLGLMDDPEYIAFIRLLFAESGRFPELAHLYVREIVNKGDQVLSCYLLLHPELNLPDPEMTARIFFGTLIAHILSQEVLQGKQLMAIANERLVDSLIRLILNQA